MAARFILRRTWRRPVLFQSERLTSKQNSERKNCCDLSSKSFTPLNSPKSFVPRSKSGFLMAGILGMLGLSKDEEEKDDNEAKLIHNIKWGILNFQRGELDKAEMSLHIALKMAQDMGNQDGVTYIFDELANIAMARGDYMKAERLFLDVMKRLISKGDTPKDDNKIVGISLKLARIYQEWNQDEKAEQGFRFCIKTQEDKIKKGLDDEDTVALWGMAKDLFAQFLLSKNLYREAFVEFQEAFLTACQVFGEEHSQSIVLLNSMGTVSSLLGEDSKALNYYEKAVKIARKIECENLSTYLVNLGMAQIKKDLREEAIKSCREGLSSGKKLNNLEVVEEANDCLKMAQNMKV